MHIHGGDIYTYQGMLDFSANINPLGLPDSVVQAAARGAAQAAAYPDTQCRELRRALAAYEQLPFAKIICGNGAADLIFALALACQPRRALLLAPGFHEYEQALRAVGCRIDYHYLREERQFQLDLPAYLAAIQPGVELVFFCNPNNPTGQVLPRPDLERILARCRECGALLVLDECFNPFLDQPEAYSLKPLLAENPSLFILKAFTKLYAMPGLRLGYGLCADEALLARLAEVSQPWRVSTPAQLAGLAALEEREYVAQTQALIQRERAFLLVELPKLGLTVYPAAANFIFFQATGPAAAELAVKCRRLGLLLRDCSNYVGLRPGFYRVAVRTHAENCQLLQTLSQALGREAAL